MQDNPLHGEVTMFLTEAEPLKQEVDKMTAVLPKYIDLGGDSMAVLKVWELESGKVATETPGAAGSSSLGDSPDKFCFLPEMKDVVPWAPGAVEDAIKVAWGEFQVLLTQFRQEYSVLTGLSAQAKLPDTGPLDITSWRTGAGVAKVRLDGLYTRLAGSAGKCILEAFKAMDGHLVLKGGVPDLVSEDTTKRIEKLKKCGGRSGVRCILYSNSSYYLSNTQ